VYDALTARFPEAEADRQDGLRLTWPAERKWAHLRPSGTEPIVRVICEARTRAEAEALVETLRDALPD
jgi:phosphomannomutase